MARQAFERAEGVAPRPDIVLGPDDVPYWIDPVTGEVWFEDDVLVLADGGGQAP